VYKLDIHSIVAKSDVWRRLVWGFVLMSLYTSLIKTSSKYSETI